MKNTGWMRENKRRLKKRELKVVWKKRTHMNKITIFIWWKRFKEQIQSI